MSLQLLEGMALVGIISALAAADLLPPRQFWQTTRARLLLFVIEGGAMVVFIYVFLQPVLDFNGGLSPAGFEWENNTGLIALARQSILDHFEFPLWNPFINTGIPYWGDPFVHLLNPLASVPALIVGAVNGPKITMLLTMIAAAFSQYYLASVLGLRGAARLWAALLFGINGHMVARFAFGHYDFAISFPFIPLCVALFIQSLRTTNWLYPMASGIANATLFFCGNLYYTVYLIPGLGVVALFSLAAGVRSDRHWDFTAVYRISGRAGLVALWTFGLSAIQLFTWMGMTDFVWKDPDRLLNGSQNMLGSFVNFFRSDPEFFNDDSYGKMPRAPQEYYSYIGLTTLLGIPWLAVAWVRNHKWSLSLLATLFLLYLALASAKHTPFKLIYEWQEWFYNFRGTYRALALATPFFILLSAFGFDALLDLLADLRRVDFAALAQRLCRVPGLAALSGSNAYLAAAAPVFTTLAIGGVTLGIFVGLGDPYDDNQDRLHLSQRRMDHVEEAQWFSERPGVFYASLGTDRSGGLSPDFYTKGVKRLPTPWGWTFIYQFPPNPNGQGVAMFVPRPEYLVLSGDVAPAETDAELVEELSGRRYYRLRDSPPYASLVSSDNPPYGKDIPWGDRARPVDARIVSANVIEATAASDDRYDTLLLLESYMPGWRLEIDGKGGGSVKNMGGFLSTATVEGEHVYRFVYDPKSFRLGASVTAGTVLGALLLGVSRTGLLGRLGGVAGGLRRRQPPSA